MDTDSEQYRQGYDTAMRGLGWNRNPYEPGSREFILFMEGHSAGMRSRARVLAGVSVSP